MPRLNTLASIEPFLLFFYNLPFMRGYFLIINGDKMMLTSPTYRQNVTDKEQEVIETAQFEAGAPVFRDEKTLVVMHERQGGAEKTQNAGTDIRKNNGVVMPWNDRPGSFGDSVGKP
jgi:hypothetical protein